MKKVLAILLAALMTVSLGACGAKAPSSAPESQAPGADEVTEVVFWHPMGGVNGQILDQLTEDFNSTAGKEKKIHVTSIYQGDDIMSKLKTVVQAKDEDNMPDVANISADSLYYMKNLSYTKWLGDLMEGDSDFAAGDFIPNAAAAFTSGGKMMGAPFCISAITFYYNKDMFKAAGLDPEQPPKTLAQVAEYAQKLTVKDGDKTSVYGFACTPNRWHVANWIGGMGEYSFLGNNKAGRDGDMTKVVFGEEGTMKKLLTEYEKIAKTGGLQNVSSQQREEFIAGQYAMIIQSSSRIAQFTEASKDKFELGVAPFPSVSADDKGGVAPGGMGLFVLDRNKNKTQAAYEFVKYCSSPEVQFKWSTSTGYIPANKNTQDLPEMQEFLKNNPSFLVPINAVANSNPNVQEPMEPNCNEISTILGEGINGLVSGELTVDEAVAQMEQQCNDALDVYYRANPSK